MEKEKTTLPSHDQVNGAMTGLRGWLSAGKNHADRGGSPISLDGYVETALAEVEWRLDAKAADEDETERPSDEELSVALAGMRGLKEDGPLADDVALLLEWLDGTDVEGREKRSRSTSPFDTEDMEAVERSIESLRSLGGEEVDLVLGEIDRLRTKFADIDHGRTVLVMSDADRATRVQDLDDASLAAWARWVFLNMERVRERMGKTDGISSGDGEPMTVGAMQGVIGLALITYAAHNTHVSFETEGVTFGGAKLGDWRVDIRQIRKADGTPVGDGAIWAEVHSDDQRARTEFDARPILLQMDHGWLLDLARCDWGGEQPADDVALMAEKYDSNVREVFEHVSRSDGGFECTIDGDRALEWLKDNRPDAWHWLIAELEKEGKY